ncbi:OFA family MFS transporter [Clostridiaceae bacterium 35-E11]
MDLNKKRWFVLIASLAINLCIGTGYSWSVFAKPLMQEFGWVAAQAALAFTVCNSISPITMISGGKIQDMFGPRWVIFVGGILFGGGIFLCGLSTTLTWLVISYGIVTGLGMGLVYSCTIANTVKFFPDKRGLIGGLATAGYGLGSIIVPPIANALIASKGILSTFKILGVIYVLVICGFSFLIMRAPANFVPDGWTPPIPTKNSAVSGVDKTWKQMLADPMFYVMLIMLLIGAFSGLMIVSQASPIAQGMVGVSPAQAAIAVSVLALFNAGGRLLCGVVSDKIGRINTLTSVFVLSAAMMMLLTTVKVGAYGIFLIAISGIGLCFGGFMGVYPAFTADSFGAKNNGVNYGIMFCGFALAGFFGPRTAASISAASGGNYTKAFIIGAVLSIIGLVITFIYRAMKKKSVLTLEAK